MEITKEMINSEISKLPKLYGLIDFADYLGWTKQRVHVYWKRKKLIEPATFISGKPVWSELQVKKYAQENPYDNKDN